MAHFYKVWDLRRQVVLAVAFTEHWAATHYPNAFLECIPDTPESREYLAVKGTWNGGGR